jgi:hypothetical protein
METRAAPPERAELELARESEALLRITGQIRQIPYIEPPETIVAAVLEAIRPRKLPWWYRMVRWATSPRSLALTPLQAAGVASVLILLSFASALHLSRSEPRQALQGGPQGGVPITLTFNMPEARSVSVVGTFNAWDENGYEMKRDETRGAWTLVLQLPAGHYEYAFVLDGHKVIPDPLAEFYEDDGFGNQNGVLIVGNRDDKAI